MSVDKSSENQPNLKAELGACELPVEREDNSTPPQLTTGLSQISFSQPFSQLSQNTMDVLLASLRDEPISVATTGVALAGETSAALLDNNGGNFTQVSPIAAVPQTYVAAVPDVLMMGQLPTQLHGLSCYSGFQTNFTMTNPRIPVTAPVVPYPVLMPKLIPDPQRMAIYQDACTRGNPSPAVSMGTRPMDSPSPEFGVGPSVVLPQKQTSKKADVPKSTTFGGVHGFRIFFTKAKETEAKKTISFTYSEKSNMLYVKRKTWCPVNFKFNEKTAPPAGSVIRATVVYSNPQYAAEVVKRCQNHATEDSGSTRQHFIQVQHKKAQYWEDPDTGRHSVITPWEKPAPETNWNTLLYQLTCFSSCAIGNASRRSMSIIFTLEHKDSVLGRQVVELRVCACPGRDRQNDEGDFDQSKANPVRRDPSPIGSYQTLGSKRCATPNEVKRFRSAVETATSAAGPSNSFVIYDDDQTVYNLPIRGRRMYNTMSLIYKNFELARSAGATITGMQQRENIGEGERELGQETLDISM